MANGDVIIKILGDDSDISKKLGGLGDKASKAMTAVAAGAAAAGAAVVALGKSALDAYATFEQLDGGVKTLFGDDAAAIVSQNAADAFKTVGMSANAYMESVTSVSASLIQSLGGDTEAAAAKADVAIRAMADNANKMGTSMDMIQNAYQGFAKQNYTMLDNLKLGYGGTKEEMQRLLDHAEELSGKKYDISSYADIVDAIQAVQEEMGIAGSSAKEIETTIEGSTNAMKAAWQNMLVGIADENADFDTLLSNLLSSVGTAAANILPRVKVILEGLGKLAVEMAPTLVTTAVELLTKLGQYLSDNVPVLLQRVPELIAWLASAIGDNAPKLVTVAGQLIVSVATGLIQAVPILVEKAPEIVGSLATGINNVADRLLQVGADLMAGLGKGIINAIPNLIKAGGEAAKSLLNKFKAEFKIQSPSKVMKDEVGAMLVAGVAQGIKENKSKAEKEAEQMSKDLLAAANKYVEDKKFYNDMTLQEEVEFWESMKKLREFSSEELAEIDKKLYAAKQGILNEEKRLADEEKRLLDEREREMKAKAESISGFAGLFAEVESEKISGKDLISNLSSQLDAIEKYKSGIEKLKEKGVSGNLLEELMGMGPDAADEIAALNDLTSAQLEKYISMYEEKQAAAKEITENFYGIGAETAEEITSATEEVSEEYVTDFEGVGEDLMGGLEEGIKNGESGVVETIKDVLEEAVKAAKDALDIHSPSRVMAKIGDFMAQGVGAGWTSRMKDVNKSIAESLSGGLEDRMANAYSRMKTAMDNGMARLSGDLAVQAGGVSSYTTNHNSTREGDFVIQIEKIVNDGKGTVTGMMEEFEFIRRQKAMAKGGA